MSTDYSSNHLELAKLASNPPSLSDDLKANAIATLQSDVSKIATDIAKEVKVLAQAAVDVDKDFFQAVNSLFDDIVSSDEFSSSLREDVSSLAKSWKTYRETYDKLLWTSRDMAGTARATIAISDLADVLTDKDASVEEKSNVMKEYMLTPDGKTQQFVQDLKNLGQDVDHVVTRWSAIVEKSKIQTYVAKIDELDKSTEQLHATFADLARKVNIVLTAAGILNAARGAASTLSAASPNVFLGQLIQHLNDVASSELLSKLSSELSDLTTQIATAQTQRKELLVDLTAPQKLGAILRGGSYSLNILFTRLSGFTDVWAGLYADLQQLQGLNSASVDISLFNAYVKGTAGLYVSAGNTLKQYQTHIDSQ